MIKIFFFIVLAIGIASVCSAQTIATKNISLDAAKKVVAEAVKYAKANNAPGGAIAVVDNGGNLVYLERLDNTFAAASEVAIKKANTAALFKAPSSKLENAINGGRDALITVGHTFLQGGVPIIVDGQVVGAVGVSGSTSAQQDEDMANAGAKVSID
ncbi:heme-binding protein [Panacibacter ginsenosidivorans]|uniref:Heme-binding protein n=1 Tax=Panacibacter ginsenosidivorans TaxID=1813871 RepID=A0A5B8VE52_9BACT|nr:heme-binding protein [Panacibacter ginsenosidivorans]QEC68936.1 heme-binding protein [Panacibacter ginsenosidivorans]